MTEFLSNALMGFVAGASVGFGLLLGIAIGIVVSHRREKEEHQPPRNRRPRSERPN